MELYDFHYAQVLANQYYNIEMLPEDFEELGLIAFERIGNARVKLHTSRIEVTRDNTIILPDNCNEVIALTYDFEDSRFVSPIYDYGDMDSIITENNIERKKNLQSPYYMAGRYVKYTQECNTLYLRENHVGHFLNLLYKEYLTENGLPKITSEEALAIATYVASVETFKKGMSTNNSALIQMSQLLEQKTARYIDQARIPDSISENAMNEILDAKASSDRKLYGKSFKPIK